MSIDLKESGWCLLERYLIEWWRSCVQAAVSLALIFLLGACQSSEPVSKPVKAQFPELAIGNYVGKIRLASQAPEQAFIYLRVVGEHKRATWTVVGTGVDYGVALLATSKPLTLTLGLHKLELVGAAEGYGRWRGKFNNHPGSWFLEVQQVKQYARVSSSFEGALKDLLKLGGPVAVAASESFSPQSEADPQLLGAAAISAVCEGPLEGLVITNARLEGEIEDLLERRRSLSERLSKAVRLTEEGRMAALGRVLLRREGELHQFSSQPLVLDGQELSSGFRAERVTKLQAAIAAEQAKIKQLTGAEAQE